MVVLSEEKMDLVTKHLAEHGFTDGVDASIDISLFEYGLLRKPDDGTTIFYGGDIYDADGPPDQFAFSTLTFDDVYETVRDDMEIGFFDMIGITKKELLGNLDNDSLALTIQDINSYNGWYRPEYYPLSADGIIRMYPRIPEKIPEYSKEFVLHANNDSDWEGERIDNNTANAIVKIVSRLNKDLANDLKSSYRSHIPNADFEVRKYMQSGEPMYGVALTPDDWGVPGSTHWRYVGNIQHSALRSINKDDHENFSKIRERFNLEPGTATPLARSLNDLFDYWSYIEGISVPKFAKEFVLMANNQYEIIDSASYKFVGGKHNKYYTITIWDSLVFDPSVKKILDDRNLPYLYTIRWGRRNPDDDPMRDYDCLMERTEVMIPRIEENIKQGLIGDGVKLLGTMGGQGQMFIKRSKVEKKRDQKTGKGYRPEGETSLFYEYSPDRFFWDVNYIPGSCGGVSPMVRNNVLNNLKKPTITPSGIPTYAKVFRLHSPTANYGTKVKGTCVKDTGAKGKTPKSKQWSPKVKEGALMGWSKDKPANVRRSILKKVIKKSDYATVIRRLNWLRNISTDKATDAAAISDMKYLQKQHKQAYASPLDTAPGWIMPVLVLGATAAAFVFFTRKDNKPNWLYDELGVRYSAGCVPHPLDPYGGY